MSKLKELREKRVAAANSLTAELQKEQTKETRAKVDEILADISVMEADIKRIEAADAVTRSLEAAAGTTPVGGTTPDPKERAKQYRKAYMEYLQRGKPEEPRGMIKGGLRQENREILEKAVRDMANAGSPEQRAQIAGIDTEYRDQQAGVQTFNYTEGALGGYFVPAGFVYDVEVATKYFCPLMSDGNCRILETATGQPLPYPTMNDTNEAWTIIGEGSQLTLDASNSNPNYPTTGASAPAQFPSDLSMGQVMFQAWKGSTGLIKISLELMQDAAFNLEQFLTEAMAVRLGRGYEYYFTLGTGNSQPKGIIPAIQAGGKSVTAAGSATNDGGSETGANSIGYQDVINLIHSVDPSYRKGAKFMMADSTLAQFKRLVDKYGRPLWTPSMKDDQPDMLCGYPYIINMCFPSIAASATTMAFGQWNKFVIRRVKDLQIVRLSERFADWGQIAFLAFSRVDSQLLDAGQHPMSLLIQHS